MIVPTEFDIIHAALERCAKSDTARTLEVPTKRSCSTFGAEQVGCFIELKYGGPGQYSSMVTLHFNEAGLLIYAEGWGE